MASSQTAKTRMQLFLENPPFMPWIPLVTPSREYFDDTDFRDGELRHDGQPWLGSDDKCYPDSLDDTTSHSEIDPSSPNTPSRLYDDDTGISDGELRHDGQPCLGSDDRCYPGPPDHMLSHSVFDKPSPEEREYVHSCIERALACPFPQSRLKESRILSYLKKVKESGTQNVHTQNGEMDQVQPQTYIKNLWPVVQDEWFDAWDRENARLKVERQQLEKLMYMWKDIYGDSLTVENILVMTELQFEEQGENMNSYNFEADILKLENTMEETRFETEAWGSQLSSTDNTYTHAARMSAAVTTSGVPEVAGVCFSQVESETTSSDDETISADDETTFTDDETTFFDDETTSSADETTFADDETTFVADETMRPYLPTMRPYLPTMRPYLPTMRPYLPMMRTYLPTMRPYLPTMRPHLALPTQPEMCARE